MPLWPSKTQIVLAAHSYRNKRSLEPDIHYHRCTLSKLLYPAVIPCPDMPGILLLKESPDCPVKPDHLCQIGLLIGDGLPGKSQSIIL